MFSGVLSESCVLIIVFAASSNKFVLGCPSRLCSRIDHFVYVSLSRKLAGKSYSWWNICLGVYVRIYAPCVSAHLALYDLPCHMYHFLRRSRYDQLLPSRSAISTKGGLFLVQVRSHGDLMLMLKLNLANRQKVVELSHANGDKFWGVWGRCLFLMMAPLFSRCQHGRVRLLAL